MATITCKPTCYRGGYSPLGNSVGYEPGLEVPSVIRYKFTTGDLGADSLSFRTTTCYLKLSTAGDETAHWTNVLFRFAITTSATKYKSYCGSEGDSCGSVYGEELNGSKSVKLMPNTTYYLWIFPNFHQYAIWTIDNCLITLSGSYGTPSTLKAEPGVLGSPLGITLSRSVDTVKHSLSVSLLGKTEQLLEKSGKTALSWTPSLETYAPLLTDTDRCTATFTAESFIGDESIGQSSTDLELSLPESLRPAVSEGWVRLSPYNTGPAEGFGCFISGYSRVSAVFDESFVDTSGLYGASIKGFSLSAGGVTADTEPYAACILTGPTQVSCTVTDSRGRSFTESFELSPLDYRPPVIAGLTACHCDQDGTENPDGIYISVTAGLNYSSLNGENSAALSLSLCPYGGTWSPPETLSSGTPLVVGPWSPDVSYEIRVDAADGLGNTGLATLKLPTRRWAMKFRPDGRGLALGKAPEHEKALELDAGWRLIRASDLGLWQALRESLTLPASAWSGNTAILELPGLKAEDIVFLDTDSSDLSANEARHVRSLWSGISSVTASENSLLFTASAPPRADLKLKLLALRI